MISDETRIQHFDRLAVAYIGGADVCEALHRHYGDGASIRQIAADQGVPVSTVRLRLMRARRRLQDVGISDRHWQYQPLA